MKNDLPYFSHDNDARNHAKMKALRARFGWTGYGQFWALNEMIAAAPDARLDLSRKVVKSSAACELGMTPDALDDFLEFLADPDECGLIHIVDNLCITTDRTQENYAVIKAERERKRGRGLISAEKRNNSAEESNNSAEESNKAKQSKGKEIKAAAAREDLSTSEEVSLFEFALKRVLARKKKPDSPEGMARTIMHESDVEKDWRRSLEPQEPPEPELPDPGPCPDCGGDRLHYPRDPRDRVRCMRCGKSAVFDFDSWVEEEAPETVDTS